MIFGENRLNFSCKLDRNCTRPEYVFECFRFVTGNDGFVSVRIMGYFRCTIVAHRNACRLDINFFRNC